MSRTSRSFLALFGVAILFKLALIVAFHGRLYPDVIGAVNLGEEVLGGVEGCRITSKTFVGPVLWYGVYHVAGPWGLKLVKLGLFAALLALHARLGRRLFGAEPLLLASALFAYYPGTNLNVAADVQQGFSSGRGVGFKLLSTGLLPAVALSWWVWGKRRDDAHLLFALVPTAYLAYVILNRDAWAAGFVMMQGVFFASFPLAELLADRTLGTPWAARRTLVGGALARLPPRLHLDHYRERDPGHRARGRTERTVAPLRMTAPSCGPDPGASPRPAERPRG